MLTKKELIYSEDKLNSKDSILESIAMKMVAEGHLKDHKQLLKAFIAREKQFSTGIGEGIAIPHAEVDGLDKPYVAVVQVKDVD